MGRSGGGSGGGRSSGGGHSSGGFSGGSRSSGGFSGRRSSSGGGRSAGGGSSFGGFFSSSRRGSSSNKGGSSNNTPPSVDFGTGSNRGGFPSMPIIINAPRYNYENPGNGMPPTDTGNIPPNNAPIGGPSTTGAPSNNAPGCASTGSGCGCGCQIIAVIIAAFFLLAIFAGVFMFITGGTSDDSSITKSTVERTALPASAVDETGYYTDADGDWINKPSELESGMRAFYKETGVQPYLYILPNGETTSVKELGAFAEDEYDKLFTDEGHFLLVFCDDGKGSYNCGYAAGAQAKTIMDDEAISILADYLDRYYYDYSLSEEQIFSDTFASTGKRIMNVPESYVLPAIIGSVVVIVAVLVFLTLKKRREQRALDQKHTEEVLKIPLEKFGDQDVDDLAKKYEGDAPVAATTPVEKQRDTLPTDAEILAKKYEDATPQNVENLASKYEDNIPTEHQTREE